MEKFEQFTSRQVDEQIERDLHASDIDANHPSRSLVIKQLQQYYEIGDEQKVSLARVWQRLEQQRVQSSAMTDKPTHASLIALPGTMQRLPRLQRTSRWPSRLGVLAALILLTLLVSSMVVILRAASQERFNSSAHTGAVQMYAQSNNGSIYRMDPVTHKVLWRFQASPITNEEKGKSLPARFSDRQFANGSYYFICQSNETYLYALNASNGTVRWKVALQNDIAEILQKPLVSNGMVYVADPLRDETLAIEDATGHVKWQHSNSGNKQSQQKSTTAGWELQLEAVSGQVLYETETMRVGSGSQGSGVPVLYAISTLDGRQIWQKAISNNISEVVEHGQLVNDTLYITTTVLQENNSGAGIYAYNVRANKLQWSEHFSNNVQALNSVVQDGSIYLETIGSPRQGSQESVLTLYALDAQKQGAIRWKYELTSYSYNLENLALVNRTVYIVSSHYKSQKNRPTVGYGIVVALNSGSGKVNWLRRINSPGALSIDQVNETELYINGLDGKIYDFRFADGTLINTFTISGGIFKFQMVS